MSAYERFRKDIEDGLYDDKDPSKKTTEQFTRETQAALAGGAMTREESRNLLMKYIDWLLRQLRGKED